MMFKRLQPQRGVALITVMLVVALVVIIAANMTGRLHLLLSRSINQQAYQQAMWSALAGEQLIYKVLEQDYKDDKTKVHLKQLWAREGMVVPLGAGSLSGAVQDLHSCFNLNALVQAAPSSGPVKESLAQRQFEHLLLAIGLDSYQAEMVQNRVKDWVDSDKQITGGLGAEDDSYSSKQLPYLTANNSMVDVSELRAIEGVTAAIYRLIRPYVCVLPEQELAINVNTISADQAHLLVGLFEGKLTLNDAQALIGNRDDEGYDDVADFWGTPQISAITDVNADIKEQLQIISNNFQSVLTFTVDEHNFTLASTFTRNAKGELAVTQRQFGQND
ncbi:type II secretion system minor pseudopilin GspK [Psychrobium sp. 1_MG-2023]|uniref:type II secretion system minor pseudopilin GspK n=1 Tax=Psychrobium sp. 1_MG-2023 TaxID=3062624 RepID=UPI000C33AD8E|nr:type II secretion system minor pseudopilin GspK [Psychrobium sp. 1_MG-2023]MDP2561938.1 type II secretion system minor pseudopilin GspK [Psychrobium sp. 1_MG-2023]PKF58679.1 general secretion pathway protein GspK [Alteromonadales bacterium alter-6D02]